MRRQTWRDRLAPTALPVRDYLGFNVILAVVLELVTVAVVAGLAVSRADGHRLSATATGVILAVGPLVGVIIASVYTYFSSITEAIGGLVLPDARVALRSVVGDPFEPRALWGRSLRAGLIATVWGAGLGVLVIAVLNRRQAGFPVLFVGMLVALGLANVVAGLAARSEAVRIAMAPRPDLARRPARRRAWRDIALPLAVLVGLTNAGFAWILFHDYIVGAQFGTHVLTEQQVFADIPLLVLLNTLIVSFMCGRAGRSEASLGLVDFEDKTTQVPERKSLFGAQGVVYTVLAGIVFGSLVKFVLPQLPNLAEAMIARAVLAGAVAYVAGGLAYIRGAGNVAAGAPVIARAARVPS